VQGRAHFTGQRKDETGLHFYNARLYNSSLGLFVSADSIVPDVADPQALNRYAYVRNNPVKHTDPSGHCWVVIGVRFFCPSAPPDQADRGDRPDEPVVTKIRIPNRDKTKIIPGEDEDQGEDEEGDEEVYDEDPDRVVVTPKQRTHILDGDETGGGHGPGRGGYGKTEFPEDMTDDEIIEEIEDIANDPYAERYPPQDNGNIPIRGEVGGKPTIVIVDPTTNTVVTAFPLPGY
jgi:RHS repeat-associated protein